MKTRPRYDLLYVWWDVKPYSTIRAFEIKFSDRRVTTAAFVVQTTYYCCDY